MIASVCGVTLMDREATEELRDVLEFERVDVSVGQSQLDETGWACSSGNNGRLLCRRIAVFI